MSNLIECDREVRKQALANANHKDMTPVRAVVAALGAELEQRFHPDEDGPTAKYRSGELRGPASARAEVHGFEVEFNGDYVESVPPTALRMLGAAGFLQHYCRRAENGAKLVVGCVPEDAEMVQWVAAYSETEA